jgi:hypothetical protein
MNVVITGAKPGDIVYLAASSNKDDDAYTAYNAKVRLGNKNFSIVTSFALTKSAFEENGGSFAKSISPISIPVDLNKLERNLLSSGTFYFQAIIFSTRESTMWASARVSELDQISVSSAGCASTYGGSAY